MMTTEMIDAFLNEVRGQAMREGTRYAQQARVSGFSGSLESVSTLVSGRDDDYEVALWSEAYGLEHRCNCPSWRDPCKHEVAAALVLRQTLETDGETPDGERTSAASGSSASAERRQMADPRRLLTDSDPGAARRSALEERVASARREKLVVRLGEPPSLLVESPSGFAYRVVVRGDASGPHSCDCPDFEANRLHTCKHVERARVYLRSPAYRRRSDHRRLATRPRVYLHFGEVIEPRLFGTPKGRGAPAVRQRFDAAGVPLPPMARDYAEMKGWLLGLGRWVEDEALDWLDRRIRRQPALPGKKIESVRTPRGLTPYPYQWRGAEFLAQRGRALLADEMGLGKTIQAILAALFLRRAERPVRRVTVVCPASLRGGWQDEIRRWTGEEAELLEGPAQKRAAAIAAAPRWLVTHYEQVWRDYRQHAERPPDLLIIDEAQRAKGLATRTARVLKAIDVPHVFALTGTPLENRLEEAYAIAQLIDQRLLPPLWQLDRDHFIRDENGKRVVLYHNLGALRSRLAPAFLRRRKEDVSLELPERIRSQSLLPMHPAVEETYEEAMQQVARIARKKVILPADAERMQRLLVIARRCCNGPHMLGMEVDDRKVPKMSELQQTLRELCLGEGRKAVVFSEWTDMTERVEALCQQLDLFCCHLRGSVPVKRRPQLIRSFSEHPGPAVFVSTDAGGVGLNLQAADVVVNLDLPWNPARLEQRIARVHRIGSRRTVQVYLLVTEGSLEHRILELHETKRNVLDNVWASEGEDTIAAPGGSGAFKTMIEALLETPGPQHDGQRAVDDARPQQADGSGPVAQLSEGSVRIAPRVESESSSRGAKKRGRRAEKRRSDREGETAREATVAGLVDAKAVAAAVAAVAPTLPAEHRQSLATVFRALAEALEGEGGGES